MDDQARSRLLELFKSRAFSFGHFILASGKESSYYVNSKKALFHSEAIALLAEAFWDLSKDLNIQAAGGLEVGAIPLAAALAQKYHLEGRELEGFFVRKLVKDHGSKDRVEGNVSSGDNVVILDDVLTTGGSAKQAVDEVEKLGAKVLAVLCIVDRLQGARELLTPQYELRSIFTIEDFGIEAPK